MDPLGTTNHAAMWLVLDNTPALTPDVRRPTHLKAVVFGARHIAKPPRPGISMYYPGILNAETAARQRPGVEELYRDFS
ncbi:hypothetical protein N7510_003101 [Penicillium lagena]|uniref:uncharacterized protein n=1 Tax=Penicillium lagena TaxID=94218 RepID=UPI0025425B31|nr:uncharacterized protein N7510_003101 [Penicillium lagena]KAJ5619117.1 hypothetical protein N7510_003101 [Penicillium lagena]